tara:strand:+ start:8132 stop:8455 length:324 start_codon:yes stop_codon:yes gene_type:complete
MDSKEIQYNSYGEIKNIKHYKQVRELFNKKELNDEEKEIISSKVLCYCGLLVSKAGIKSHITNSLVHRKRMSVYNIDSGYYVNPTNAYSRIQYKIEVTKDNFVIDFD